MLQLIIFPALLLANSLTLTLATSLHDLQDRHCAAPDPSPHLLAAHTYLSWAEPLDNDLHNASTIRVMNSNAHPHEHHGDYSHEKRQAQFPLYTIDTYFHIVADTASSTPSSTAYVTDTMIRNQFQYLAVAYTNASIGFRLMGASRTTNDTWAANGDDLSMKSALRRGTYSALNVYFQSQLQSGPGTPGIPAGSILLGYCSLPATGVTKGLNPAAYVKDGCNVLSGTMPGGGMYGYNLGGSAVHEIGHWNGLLHTFQDNSCSPYDYGDFVADTPQQSTSTNGCPTGKDSCPNSGVAPGYNGALGTVNPYGPSGYSGLDPIHNFMDYSSDACYAGFTAGQGARMLNIWQIYRQGL